MELEEITSMLEMLWFVFVCFHAKCVKTHFFFSDLFVRNARQGEGFKEFIHANTRSQRKYIFKKSP